MPKIKFLVMDVDGTLTDGKIYMGSNGELMKAFDIKDGYGIHDLLKQKGITPVIITGRTSPIVMNRCKELGITELFQGINNKKTVLLQYIHDKKATFDEVAYIGDDLNDLLCMKMIKSNNGVIGCPNDAIGTIKEICDFISTKNGGNGAVRDFIDYLTQ